MMKKARNRRLADCDLFLRQSGCKLCERNVRLVRHQLPNQLLMLYKREILVAAKLRRTDAGGVPVKFHEPPTELMLNPHCSAASGMVAPSATMSTARLRKSSE
jgi:hypothetical protein